MIIYLSGPITGVENYADSFFSAAAELAAQGHVILNPAVLPEGLGDYEKYMRICMAMLDEAETIVLLPGWQNSPGAKREYYRALANGLTVLEWEVFSLDLAKVH